RTVLVVGAYLMHRLADPKDPMIFFYGDGAGAAVVEADSEPGFLGAAFRADGRYAGHWGIYAGGTAEPASAASVAAGRTRVRLLERYPPEVNEEGWQALVRELAEQNQFGLDQIDHAVFTQVNRYTIESVCDDLGIPRQRAPLTMGQWGYTGSACVPMALDALLEKGRAAAGDLLVLIGSGVGYNMAGVAIRLTERLAGP
ncbi:MAG: 3-oxoacyl-[acyl-carrier-protein] synthase III C-terminal domain-containing protein, partial [Ectothiorhodospiraceae bacterium]